MTQTHLFTDTPARLFLDLDGVLADFDHGVKALLGKAPHRIEPSRMWRALARHEGFYASLEWMPGGRQLWEVSAPLSPTILTGLPRGEWAEPQKRAWCAQHLGEDVPVITCMSRHKPRWSAPNHVLVDDRASQQQPWTRKGGIFILHTSVEDTLSQLRALGLFDLDERV